jgi:hypothetical protein
MNTRKYNKSQEHVSVVQSISWPIKSSEITSILARTSSPSPSCPPSVPSCRSACTQRTASSAQSSWWSWPGEL